MIPTASCKVHASAMNIDASVRSLCLINLFKHGTWTLAPTTAVWIDLEPSVYNLMCEL
jgi:hypothetical protein